jgi:predicted transcriptional regulator
MAKPADESLDKKIDVAIDLLRHLVAIELWKAGLTQEAIGKRIHIAKAKVVTMVKGVSREKMNASTNS